MSSCTVSVAASGVAFHNARAISLRATAKSTALERKSSLCRALRSTIEFTKVAAAEIIAATPADASTTSHTLCPSIPPSSVILTTLRFRCRAYGGAAQSSDRIIPRAAPSRLRPGGSKRALDRGHCHVHRCGSRRTAQMTPPAQPTVAPAASTISARGMPAAMVAATKAGCDDPAAASRSADRPKAATIPPARNPDLPRRRASQPATPAQMSSIHINVPACAAMTPPPSPNTTSPPMSTSIPAGSETAFIGRHQQRCAIRERDVKPTVGTLEPCLGRDGVRPLRPPMGPA